MRTKMNRFRSFLLVLAMVISVVSCGFVPGRAEEASDNSYTYEAENFYSGNISEGIAADMQPNESIRFTLGSNGDFVAGVYKLTVKSCGNRTSFEVLVNDQSVGSVGRTETGFGADQMTVDSLGVMLNLKPEDTLTIVAPADGYGWLDNIRLEKLSDEAVETGNGYYIYQVEYFYAGNISEGVAADMQPNETISIKLHNIPSQKYTLTVYSCGNRESFDILVNGEKVGTITRTGTGFGQDQMTYDKLETVLELDTDDVITIVAPEEGYGWVDFVLLDVYAENNGGDDTDDPIDGDDNNNPPAGDDNDNDDPADTDVTLPEGATETHEGYYVYQTEYFYNGNICEEVAADLQPGEQIEIALNANSDFAAGQYTLTIYSCGNRESFGILVNGEKVGTITRTGTGFGQDQMTYDKLEVVLELDADDVITIVAADDGYGWVDFAILSVYSENTDEENPGGTEAEPGIDDADTEPDTDGTETQPDTKPKYDVSYDYIIYQCENYYSGNISEGVAADLQPGENLDILLGSDDTFQAGYYQLTVYSCGNRESFDVLVNGEKVGTITRTGTGFGQDQMTYDKLSVTLELKPEDTITLVAPDGQYYGWVDHIVLDVIREPAQTGDEANLLIPVVLVMSVTAMAALMIGKRKFFC